MMQMGIKEKDKDALKSLTSIIARKSFIPQTSILIEMNFAENDYFLNKQLSFTCKETSDNKRAEQIIGCTINWKSNDKDVTKKIVEHKEKGEKSKFGEKRQPIIKTEVVPDHESFFNVFSNKKAPEGYFENPQEDGEDSDLENTIASLDEAHDCANDIFDMYMKEGFENYFGLAENVNDILRDDYVEEYEEWEDIKPEDIRTKVYKAGHSSDSSSESSDSPKKRKVIKKRVVKRTLGKEDCKQ